MIRSKGAATSANRNALHYYARAVQCYNPFAMTPRSALVMFRYTALVNSTQALPGSVPRTPGTAPPAFLAYDCPPPL